MNMNKLYKIPLKLFNMNKSQWNVPLAGSFFCTTSNADCLPSITVVPLTKGGGGGGFRGRIFWGQIWTHLYILDNHSLPPCERKNRYRQNIPSAILNMLRLWKIPIIELLLPQIPVTIPCSSSSLMMKLTLQCASNDKEKASTVSTVSEHKSRNEYA